MLNQERYAAWLKGEAVRLLLSRGKRSVADTRDGIAAVVLALAAEEHLQNRWRAAFAIVCSLRRVYTTAVDL